MATTSVPTTAPPPIQPALTPAERQALLRPISFPHPLTVLLWLAFLALVIWSLVGVEISPQKLERFWPNIVRFVSSLWPPDNAYWPRMLDPILATVQMAFLGTILAVILSFPFALLAASNTSPHPLVYQTSRMILNVIRAIPALVWAIIFVAAMGFGPFAGVIALGVGQVGVLGKLYSEAIEAINPRQVEAVRATGAGVLQVFSFGVLPQALPLMISYTLLDFESNVRSATILGIVGAGGIGFELQASFSQFQFKQVMTILIDSADGMHPGAYFGVLMAGKDSPVKTVQDVRGQDFTLVDPASTSGNLFPRVMLLEEGIDPNKDIKARYAGNHQNSILAVAKGQVPCGASNNLSLNSAVRNGIITPDEIVILKESAPIPNGPYTVSPDLDPRATAKLVEVMTAFSDLEVLKKMEHVGPLIPASTEMYDFVRRAAKLINLEFDEKGNAKPVS